MGTPQMGHQSRLAFDTGAAGAGDGHHVIGDFNSDSKEFEYLSENVVLSQTRFHSDGIRGTRSRHEARCRITQEAVGGTITMHPTQVELDTLLPLILGANEVSTDTFNVAETIPSFGILIDRVQKRFCYSKCVVSSATFSASAGGPLQLSMEIVGQKETVSGTAFPTVGALATDAPFIMADTAISLAADASATELASFSITVNNMVNAGRFMNSLTRTATPSGGREVTVQLAVPYTADEVDLYNTALSAYDNSYILIDPGGSNPNIKFTFGGIEFGAQSPTVSSKGDEYSLNLSGVAYKTASANELVVVNAAT
tara:strand:+ start:11443 stop:12381 length:939 start_codon:yes stop_codon:yes gene_type:complete